MTLPTLIKQFKIMNYDKFINKKVLVRTHSAGVHFGTLLEKDNQELRLGNARRLWSWNSDKTKKLALSISEVATTGIDIKTSKISEPVEEIILPNFIELLPLSSNLCEL